MKYLKTDNGQLYSSIVTFEKPGSNVRFKLFPVVHVGRREYYELAYKKLNENDYVLYEGFGEATRSEKKQGTYRSSAQKMGLVSQDEAINYRRLPAKWIRADLKGEAAKQAVDDLMFHEKFFLKNLGILNAAAVGLFSVAFANRRALAELLAQFQNAPMTMPLFERLSWMITGQREKVIYRKIGQFAATQWDQPITVAIFYGAGHMAALTKHLTETLGYQESSTEWIEEAIF